MLVTCTHRHTNVHSGLTVWQICTQAHFDRDASANTNKTDIHTHTHCDSQTHKSVTLVLHCVCLLALFRPSHCDSQSLLIRATSASTGNSVVKCINEDTKRLSRGEATSGLLEWRLLPAEGADELPTQWRERGGRSEVSFVRPASLSPFSDNRERNASTFY